MTVAFAVGMVLRLAQAATVKLSLVSRAEMPVWPYWVQCRSA
jgi:hypothetical protein